MQDEQPFPTSPVQQVAAAAVGVLLLGGGRRRSGHSGTVLQLAGLTLIGLALRPLIVRKIRAAGAERRHFVAHSSIEIARPVSDVFAFFKDFESFPRVVGALRSVKDYEDGRSHWEIYTPSGDVASWDVVVSKYMPNNVIGWESVPGSAIEMRGVARFASVDSARTRLDLDLSYQPAHTGLNDALYAMVRPRPVGQLKAALEHAKFYLESLPAASPELEPEHPPA